MTSGVPNRSSSSEKMLLLITRSTSAFTDTCVPKYCAGAAASEPAEIVPSVAGDAGGDADASARAAPSGWSWQLDSTVLAARTVTDTILLVNGRI
jgi:hypothetical protein